MANAALWEFRPKPGDRLTVLALGIRDDDHRFEAVPLGLHLTEEFRGGVHLRNDDDFKASLERRGISRQWLVQDDFLSRLASTEYPPNSQQDNYRLSVEVARVLRRDPSCEGLMHPSVAVQSAAINFAIRPEVVKRLYRPMGAWEFTVTRERVWLGKQWAIPMTTDKITHPLQPDGILRWEESHLPIEFLYRAGEILTEWRNNYR